MSLTRGSTAFLEKVKLGKAQAAGSGFGGKGLDRLEKDRDTRERAQRAAYGEGGEEKRQERAGAAEDKAPDIDLPEINVEIKRGPAPDSRRSGQLATATGGKR
jgi:ATP-dependent RNA helicase DDX46/PRP5